MRSYKRAVAINGVAVPGERADLQDRVLPVSLKRGGKRRTDADLRAAFDRAHPELLGTIFDALSAALRHFDPTAEPPDFRLGDWALHAAGVYEHAGWSCLADDLAGIERARSEAVVDGSPVARAVMRRVKTTANFTEWRGTPGELYDKCREMADEVGDLAIFPRAPNTFTGRLREATQALAEHGIRVESGKSDKRRWVRISRDDGRDDTPGGPSRRDDTGAIDRPGEPRSHSGDSPIRDGRDDASANLYGGSLMRKNNEDVARGDTGVPVHLAGKTVPTVPLHDAAADAQHAAVTADTYEPLDVERLCVDVEADAIAAGNAKIERQGLEPTVANNAAIDWHAVWAAETRHVVSRIEALRQAGHEHAAVAIMRQLPAPTEPTDDVQEEWAMLNRPFDYRMDERLAYALYAESVTDYPMGAAMSSTGYPLKPRKTESDRPM